MAKIKVKPYKSQFPASHYMPLQTRAREKDADLVYWIIKFILKPLILGLFRAEVRGLKNVPLKGPVVLVPNHFSFWDHFLVGMFIRRPVRFMAKSQMFDGPMKWVYTHGGCFPVARGERDEEAFLTAALLLRKGQIVVMYQQGTRSDAVEVEWEPRPGVGKLALMTGVWVIPVGLYGTRRLREWKRGWLFPKLTVEFGQPLRWPVKADASREEQMAVSREVFDHFKILHDRIRDERSVRWFHRFLPPV